MKTFLLGAGVVAGLLLPATFAATIGQIDTFQDNTTDHWFPGGQGLGRVPANPPHVVSGGQGGSSDLYLVVTAVGGSGDQFDFAFQPSIDERQIGELRTLRFVHEASNVILREPPGRWKNSSGGGAGGNGDPVWSAGYLMTARDLVTCLGRGYRERCPGGCESISPQGARLSMKWVSAAG